MAHHICRLRIASLALALRIAAPSVVYSQVERPHASAEAASTQSAVKPYTYQVEDFGLHPFAATPEEVTEGERQNITSEPQRQLWLALMSLMMTSNGYHTSDEVTRALGIKLKADPERTSIWVAALPSARLELITTLPHTPSMLSVYWEETVTRPQCVGALKAFAAVQSAGGIGFQEIGESKWFRVGQAGEQVGLFMRGYDEYTCLSGFRIIGRAR